MIKMVYDIKYRPHPDEKDNVVSISNDGLTVNYGKGYNYYVRSSHPIPSPKAKIYTEFTITGGTGVHYNYVCLTFGISDNKNIVRCFSMESGTFYNTLTWGGELKDKITVSNWVTNGRFYIGNTVGIAIDPSRNIITIYKNGKELAYYGGTTTDIINDKMYYIFVRNNTSYEYYILNANFGLTPFKYPVPSGHISLEKAYELYPPSIDGDLKIY